MIVKRMCCSSRVSRSLKRFNAKLLRRGNPDESKDSCQRKNSGNDFSCGILVILLDLIRGDLGVF